MASKRVITPNTMVMLNEDCPGDNSGSLSRPASRQSASSRIGSGLPRRTPTPTKQVFLTTVRRKDSGEYDSAGERPDSALSKSSVRHNGFYGDVQAMTSKFNQPAVPRGRKEVCSRGDYSNSIHFESDSPSENKNNSGLPTPNPQLDQENISKDSLNHSSTDIFKTGSDDDDSNDDKGDTGEEEEKKAPSELLMEFVGCLMEKDYENAEKLCKMILLYEPENPEALKFQPLIQEKLQQEEDEENTGGDSGDDDEEEDDDDDDDDDDESDSETSDSEDSSSEEEEGKRGY